MKFGGTSVGSVEAFARVARIVSLFREAQPVVVVSAMTKMTDALLSCAQDALQNRVETARETLETQLERHFTVARHFLDENAQTAFARLANTARAELHNLFQDASERLLPRPILQDSIVAYGEFLSANLLAAVLRAHELNARFVDPRFCIVTDNQHGQAAPLWEETGQYTRSELLPVIDEGAIPVLGGFIGATISGKTTTLGRGGSDYSAAIIGAMLEAREVQIWTDVPGVMTADPRLVPAAKTVPLMSYDEAAELAYFGAKVLHPRTIQPAIELKIPVRVLNSFDPEDGGTTISAHTDAAPQLLKAIAHKKGVTVLRITSGRMVGTWGFLRSLFEVFDRFRTSIDVIATSEASVSMTLDNDENLAAIIRELKRLGEVEVEPNQAVICVVGEGLRATSGMAAKIFAALENINVSMVSHGASSVNLTFVVAEQDMAAAALQLHQMFFQDAQSSKLLPGVK
jgi:aspartate kinase